MKELNRAHCIVVPPRAHLPLCLCYYGQSCASPSRGGGRDTQSVWKTAVTGLRPCNIPPVRSSIVLIRRHGSRENPDFLPRAAGRGGNVMQSFFDTLLSTALLWWLCRAACFPWPTDLLTNMSINLYSSIIGNLSKLFELLHQY